MSFCHHDDNNNTRRRRQIGVPKQKSDEAFDHHPLSYRLWQRPPAVATVHMCMPEKHLNCNCTDQKLIVAAFVIFAAVE